MAAKVTWYTTDESELKVAYSGSTVILGFQEAQDLLVVTMSVSQAIHLMMELRESLKDINIEDAGSTD